MLSSARIRPLIARWRDWLPLAVLTIALASAVALGGDRGYLYRLRGIHNDITAKNLAVAGNMSPKHGFRLATRIRRDEGGGFEYNLYGRFPIGGYILIKAAILPFGSDLAAKLLAARFLMLSMFCGAAIFAYLALARIAGSRWIALAAALFAFSSLYPLYYADSVAGETVMDLFGVMLVFHGMVAFVQEGRFRQLLVKTCAALFLGWHVYALIMPFALWGFGGEALALVRASFASGGGIRAAALSALPALARSRFAALAAVSILFGSALLGFNLFSEYTAFEGERTLSRLPTAESMLKRLGATDAYEGVPEAEWGNFLVRQFHRAGGYLAPYAVEGFRALDFPSPPPARAGWGVAAEESPSSARAAAGVAAAVAAVAALALFPRRFRAPVAAVALMGLCWALAARGNAYAEYHSHEALFHVGLPLALWLAALIGARRLLGARLGGALAIGAAALAAPVFALSAFHAAQIRQDADSAKRAKEIMADMSAISEIAAEKSVAVYAGANWKGTNYALSSDSSMRYYLAGSYFWDGASGRADYAISRYRDESPALLTPDNRHLFLYERAGLAALHEAERRRLEASEPSASGSFDVYLEEGALRYLKSPCAPGDTDAFFFAHFFPPDAAYLRREGDQVGWVDGVNFPFSGADGEFDDFAIRFDDACMTTVNIPRLPIAAIRTGQYISDRPGVSNRGAETWEVAIFPPPSAETLAAYERAYQAVASGEPAARSGFDLHLNGNNALTYLKEPCSEEDARGRFFLSVHPANAADLPAARREIGHESLNFDFEPPHGVVFNGKCMATRQLPDYEIAKIETGQDAPGGGRLWAAEIEVGE